MRDLATVAVRRRGARLTRERWLLRCEGGPAAGRLLVANGAPQKLGEVGDLGCYVVVGRDDARRRAVYAWARRGVS